MERRGARINDVSLRAMRLGPLGGVALIFAEEFGLVKELGAVADIVGSPLGMMPTRRLMGLRSHE